MNARVTQLPNGLRVVSETIPTVETASVGVWVEVGTRHEAPEVNGVSHLLEHMAFKGTRRRSARAIAEEIEAVGGHINAYTSRENTAYYAKVLKEDLGLAVDIIADITQHARMDEAELARERAVVLQEINQAADTPDDIVFDYFQATAFPDQPLGRPVLGETETVRNMPRDTLLDYMKTRYSGPRMVLSAAGNLDHDRLVAMAQEAFSALPDHGPFETAPALYQGGECRKDKELEQVHVILGFDGLTYHDPDFYAVSVFTTLFGGGMSSRLFQEIREERGLCYSVYSFSSSYSDGGLFGIYAGTGNDELPEMMPLLCTEIKKVQDGVTAEEVQRARAQLKASILMSLESTSSRCEQIARQLTVFGRIIPTEEIVAKVEAVDIAAVQRVAQRIFASPMTLTALGPISNLESKDALLRRIRG